MHASVRAPLPEREHVGFAQLMGPTLLASNNKRADPEGKEERPKPLAGLRVDGVDAR
jgi:hypothetical protein